MTTSLVIPPEISDELHRAAGLQIETAGVLLAGIAEAPNGDIRLLGRQIRWVPDDMYTRRERDGLTIPSEGYVPALAEAERISAIALWIHTHPGQDAIPKPSNHDQFVDTQIADLFRIRADSPFYGTLIVSPASQGGLSFAGFLQREKSKPLSIERMWELGPNWRLTQSWASGVTRLPPIFDRNIRAFGGTVQAILRNLRIAVVGCGGTGSAVAEQLVRLGVRHLLLIDPDYLSDSNVTRVYGSGFRDVGRPKVEILRSHLRRISDEVRVEAVQSMLTLEPTARQIISCDLVFGCTDDNAGRLVLSRFSTYLHTPIIDCGVLLSGDSEDRLSGIDGRITVLSPGQACLVCRDRIDVLRARAELLTPEERRRLENEGYAPALGQTEPAVVTYTTMVAAAAVSELLERMIGYGPPKRPSEILLRCHEREISTNIALPRDGHYCHPSSEKAGRGMTEPFLEQAWPA